MIGKLARFRALSRPEQQVLVVAMLLLPLFWIGLRVLGLLRFCAWLDHSPVVARTPYPGVDPAALGALVTIAGNHVPVPTTCLTRSLVLNWLLHRRGVCSELRIGVRLTPGLLEAHAWVEHGGRPINDAPDIGERFAPFHEPISYRLFA